MSKYQYDMIVIGGGAAGLTASTACGSTGARALLIEKDEKLGGDCLHYGCVPSKSLIKSAYAYQVMKDSEKYGLPRVDVPPVDMKNVMGRIRSIIADIQIHDEPDYLKKTYNVETRFGKASFVDAHTVLLNGKKLTAKHFVIATGSSPSVPPIDGINDVPYLTNVEVFSLEALPESMIVLGGGAIGLELAQAFSRLGTRITVVEAAPRVLMAEDEDISGFVEEMMTREGTVIKTGAKAVKVTHDGSQVHLTLESNGNHETLSAERLLVATGRSPNVDGLELDNAGVVFDKSGIWVDDRLRTSVKHIFGCGDVNGRYPFTHVAAYEATIAMMVSRYPFLTPFVKADYTNVPWVTYLDPEVASIGYNEARAKAAGLRFTVHKESLARNDRARAEGETDGFIKLLVNEKSVVIGCQIVAIHAGDLIHEWAAMINGQVSLQKIATTIHAYPTLAEINKTAGLNYFLSASPMKKLRMLMNWRW